MKRLHLFILIVMMLTACAPKSDTTPESTATPLLSTVTPADSAPTESQADSFASFLWKEVRNERFGFGMAVPCWWEVTPMPAEGILSSMSMRNYDDAFFQANSEKGTWIGGFPPQGVMSMDVTAATGIDPTLSMVDAYLQLVDTSTYAVLSTQERNIENRVYTVVALKNQNNPSEPASVVYVKGLTPDTILIFSTFPTEAIFSSDAQLILSSFASMEDEEIAIPNVPPSPAFINMACPL